MRFDRHVTLNVVRPWRRTRPLASMAGIPILMYHSISDDLDTHRRPYFRTATSPARFSRHMSLLSRRGVHTLTLAEAARTLAAPGGTRPGRAVVVTFDDGYSDFKTLAFPVMRDLGIRATVFVSTGYMGKPFFDGRPCLCAADMESLAEQGVEFGSHTVTHPQLREVTRVQMMDELALSRDSLMTLLGQAATSFSYPFRIPSEDAAFMVNLASALLACGYEQGVTTAIGIANPADPPYFLRRLPVNDCDDDALFLAKLDGHYDWLGQVQSARKQVRACLGI